MARMHVCSQPGCPEVQEAHRCPAHARQVEQARGSRQQRGYGAQHDKDRERLLSTHIAGAPCPRCELPMLPGQALDAGHSVDLRDNRQARADRLEHASCNRAWRRGQRGSGVTHRE